MKLILPEIKLQLVEKVKFLVSIFSLSWNFDDKGELDFQVYHKDTFMFYLLPYLQQQLYMVIHKKNCSKRIKPLEIGPPPKYKSGNIFPFRKSTIFT
jgi:hypothetical protein